jgi:hypothetical protein
MKRQRLIGVMGVMTLSLYAFLGRGGEVIGFYLVPLLPLLALNVALVFGLAATKLKTFIDSLGGHAVIGRTIQLMTIAPCLIGILGGYFSPNLGFQSNHFLLWNSDQTDAQVQAIEWVEEHVPPDSKVIIDCYMWTDLHDTGNFAKNYPFAHWYWKVDLDPAITKGVFHNNWRNIDYIVTTDQMVNDVPANHLLLMEQALVHSTLLAHFDTGGWPVEIRKVNKEEGQSLQGQSISLAPGEIVQPRQTLAYMEEHRYR